MLDMSELNKKKGKKWMDRGEQKLVTCVSCLFHATHRMWSNDHAQLSILERSFMQFASHVNLLGLMNMDLPVATNN